MNNQLNLFIDGEWIETNDKLKVLNKYSGETYAEVSKAGEREVNKAIEGAERAFKQEELPPYKRYEIIKKVSELLQEEKESFTNSIISEAGKPRKQASTEVDRAIQTFEVAAEEAKRISGQGVPVELRQDQKIVWHSLFESQLGW